MKITRKSPISGEVNEMELPITWEQLDFWESGEPIQKVFPNLTSGQREFIMTGITEAEMKEAFAEEDDEF